MAALWSQTVEQDTPLIDPLIARQAYQPGTVAGEQTVEHGGDGLTMGRSL
jgi:hypothetical protein